MEKLILKGTSLEVSRIIVGCMGLGGGWDKGTILADNHVAQADAFIEKALELGLNFFDHADIYAHGRAEEAFGAALKKRPGLRGQMVIQSKCGIRWEDDPPGSPHRFDFSRGHIISSVEGSLRRLGTEYLDILLLHRPDLLWEGEEVAQAFAELKASGKVRYFGVSNQNRAWLEYLQSFLPDPLVANQVQMSLLHHDFAEVGISFNQNVPHYPNGWEGLIEYCRLHGVALQAWSPLDQGTLTGKNLSEQPENVKKTAALVDEYARAYAVPREAIALAWLLRHPAKIMPVTGTTRPDRLEACAKATELTLSREEWYALFEAARGNDVP
ncbi:MAG: aldo/keto reductase [Spirochaetaceae bacterium]|nr:aldo/keto reductase [Spirochaetaceae bacterium]